MVVFSGHMIDTADRGAPRFPAEKEASVTRAIAASLEAIRMTRGNIGICGGACGGDIIFAECCLATGAKTILLIGKKKETFISQSVTKCGTDWINRFEALLTHPNCETVVEPHISTNNSENEFEIANERLITYGFTLASPRKPTALALWDEMTYGDGKGGTSHFVLLARHKDMELTIINPAKL